MFFSLFLLATNNFNLLKINLFNDVHKHNLSIDSLHIGKANALEMNDTNNNFKIINNNDNKDNENKNRMMLTSPSKVVELEKDSNKKTPDENGGEDDNNLHLKNTTTPLQNTGLTTTTTKSFNSIGSFNFAAAGDWACTSKSKDTVKNIIDHNPELVLALGDLSYDNGAKCWLKIIKPIAEKTKIVIGNNEADSSKKLKDYMKDFDLEKAIRTY
jgi:hypothetical protein